MKEKKHSIETQQLYNGFMKGYESTKYVNSDWQMQGGIYRQYSVYEDNDSCTSGTNSSIKSIIL